MMRKYEEGNDKKMEEEEEGRGGRQSMFGIPGRNQDIDCSYAAY